MTESRNHNKITAAIILLAAMLFPAAQVQAKEPTLPPHLIQSVSEQDIYEGLLALEMLHCPVLDREELEKACENVKDSVVRLMMGQAYGSGVLFSITEEGVVIATNRHVLEYWREGEGIVWFPQGYFMDARILGMSETCDVGFLQVDAEAFSLQELMSLRSVFVEEQVCAGLQGGTKAFCIGADRSLGEMVFQEVSVEEPVRYIEVFGAQMLYCRGFAKEGMSGGGLFDCRGNLIGLLAGGTEQNEIAAVPAREVETAWQTLVGE